MYEFIEKQESKQELKPPAMWNVIVLNDDFTPMEFVVICLMTIFNKTQEQAIRIMLNIHEQGKGIAGTYTHDIALTKQAAALDFAKSNGHPLLLTVEQI